MLWPGKIEMTLLDLALEFWLAAVAIAIAAGDKG